MQEFDRFAKCVKGKLAGFPWASLSQLHGPPPKTATQHIKVNDVIHDKSQKLINDNPIRNTSKMTEKC